MCMPSSTTLVLPGGMSLKEEAGGEAAAELESTSSTELSDAFDKINRCKDFCNRVAETASMHSPPITATEINLARLLQQAMTEIRQQLDGLELEVVRGVSRAVRTDFTLPAEQCGTA